MEPSLDYKIIESWKENAHAWVQSIESGSIESRILVTNSAILDAVLDQNPQNVWDLGCGEGWLLRDLAKKGIGGLGTDTIASLLEKAKEKGGGEFKLLAYEDLHTFQANNLFDVIVCNFSLLGKESVDHVFAHIASFLSANGKFIIQSLHPNLFPENEEGWRTEDWAGFKEKYTASSLWYYRSLSSWKNLFQKYQWKLEEIREALHPQTSLPASIIFIASKAEM